MKYTGGKQQLVKHIAPILQEALSNSNGQYYEPFVGGANMFCKVKASFKVGSDVDCDLIAFLRFLRDNGTKDLPYISQDLYQIVKSDPNSYEPYLKAYVSICGSFQGKKWGGYSGAKQYKTAYRDYPAEALRELAKQQFNQSTDTFECQSYDKLVIAEGSVVYCDPPYASTTGYKSGDVDLIAFWDWVRKISQHSQVFVSKYTAPDDFEVVWSKQRKSSTDLVKAQTKTELLVKFRKP